MTSQIKRINRCLILGWIAIVLVLFVSYIIEVVKGDRDIPYLLSFLAVTVITWVIVGVKYLKAPETPNLRYYFTIGFFAMYAFVLLTGSTIMVFVYILPMLSLMILYHDPKLVLWSGILAMIFNIIALFVWKECGMLREAKDHEIQVALVFLCFLGCFLAANIYDNIYKTNMEYTQAINLQNQQMREMTMQTIMTIANTIDAKDEYTRGHSRRVAEYAAAIARELGYDDKQVSDIRFIGLLHDIGKIGVPDSVLNKPGRLSDEEYRLMKDHTVIGAEILKDISMVMDLNTGAKYHHEHYDGTGYPEGLKGEEIPAVARMIGVADAYDAMSSNRVYRKHLEPEKVMQELKKGCGKQFDPEACNAIIRLIEEKRLPVIDMEDSHEVKQASQILSRVIDKAEELAVEDLHLDELTGTFRRAQGKYVIQEQINTYGKGSIFIVDLDGFRKVNETEGFMVGDMYLKAVADQLRELSANIYVARFGADEFIAYLPDTETAEDAESIADYFISTIRDIASGDEKYAKLSVCVGITQIATEKDRVMVAYENANKALYVAKQCGTGSYFCHRLQDEEEHAEAAESVDLKQLTEVLKKRENYKGAYNVAYPEFGRIYDLISNLAERNDQQVHIILFTVREIEEGGITNEERDTIMDLLEKAIVSSIRTVDATTRYSNVQRVVLLMNLNEEQTGQVINRIMADFYRMYDRKDVEIHYDSADLSRG